MVKLFTVLRLHRKWLYSIRTKLVIVTSLIIAIISLFIYWFFPARLEQQALAAHTEKANTIATMMAYSIAPALREGDRVVSDIVLSAMQNPDLDYVMVLNDVGQTIAAFDSNKAIALEYGDVDFKEKISSDGLTFQTVAPIITQSKVLGRVYLGISLRPLLAEVAESRRTISRVSFVVGVIGILFMVVFSAVITRPLVKVVEATKKVSSGDLKQRALVISQDEVGQLALAFNTMVGSLELAYDDLRRSEKNYRDLFASNPHPMWVFDLDTVKFIDVNDAAIEGYGFSREEFLTMTIHDIVMEKSPEKMRQLLTRQGNLYRSTGWRHLKRDGSVIDVEMSSHTLPLRGGRKARLVLANDITGRLRAEALLRESEERYRDLFESASDLILSVGPDCRFTFVNRAWTEALGYTELEARGLNIFDIVKKSELPQLRVHFRDALNGKRLDRVQTVFMTRKGHEVVVEGSLSTKFVRGAALSTRGIFRDVTERKRAEEKRASLMQELENINKELNDFAYIVSHDLKAPLRGIGSLVNWIVTDYGDRLGDEGNDMLKMLLGRTTRMHELIDGVLKYSRIGRQKDELLPIELDELVPEIVELIAPPPHIEVKIQRPLPVVTGEPTRIRQVFQNLLSNAVKFIDKPKGCIEIGHVRENGHWKFSIADNGPGIEERHFAKIFQIFQTLSARDSYESTGIGLTIVKKIVENYGGKIWLESSVGVGTTFYFTLPVKEG